MAALIVNWGLNLITIGLLVMLVYGYRPRLKPRRKSVYRRRGMLSVRDR